MTQLIIIMFFFAFSALINYSLLFKFFLVSNTNTLFCYQSIQNQGNDNIYSPDRTDSQRPVAMASTAAAVVCPVVVSDCWGTCPIVHRNTVAFAQLSSPYRVQHLVLDWWRREPLVARHRRHSVVRPKIAVRRPFAPSAAAALCHWVHQVAQRMWQLQQQQRRPRHLWRRVQDSVSGKVAAKI